MKIFDVVGWDNGYVFEKFVVDDMTTLIFPSVICRSRGGTMTSFKGFSRGFSKDKMVLEFNGQEFLVGQYAVTQDSEGGQRKLQRDKFKEDAEVAKLLAGLCALAAGETEIHVNKLMLGLNIGSYKAFKEELVEFYSEKEFKCRVPREDGCNELVEIQIDEVNCTPQGMGAIFNSILDEEAKPVNAGLLKTRYGVVDIGGKTVDAFISEGLEPIRGSDVSFDYGVLDAFKEVSQKTGIPVNLIERDYIWGKEKTIWQNQEYDLFSKVESAFELQAKEIAERLENEWVKQIDRIDSILLCGGPAGVLIKHFESLFRPHIQIKMMENAQIANARGYYKLGLFLKQRQSLNGEY